jgi:hypothetical protein
VITEHGDGGEGKTVFKGVVRLKRGGRGKGTAEEIAGRRRRRGEER